MSSPQAVCIEDLDASDEARFVSCVALPGGEPGLGLDGAGQARWRRRFDLACELLISGDDRLVLLRDEEAPAVEVSRAGRSLQAPAGKPVVLLDGDRLNVGGRRLRVHLHGEVEHVYEPTPLTPEPSELSPSGASRAAAAALAAVVGAAGCAGADAGGSGPVLPPVEPTSGTEVDAGVKAAVDAAVKVGRLECKILTMYRYRGRMNIHMRCGDHSGLKVGVKGHVLEGDSSRRLPNGEVIVRRVAGNMAIATLDLERIGKNRRVLFEGPGIADGRKISVDMGAPRPPIVVRHRPPVVVPPPRRCKIITLYSRKGKNYFMCRMDPGTRLKVGMQGHVVSGSSRQRVPNGKVTVHRVTGKHAILITRFKSVRTHDRWVIF